MPEPVFDVYKDARGEWRWRLKAVNGQVIATGGESYKEKRSCEDGIASVIKNAAIAKIVEEKQ